MNMEADILNKIFENLIQHHIKRIIHHDQVGFIFVMQDGFSYERSMCVIFLINRTKTRIHIIILAGAEKYLTKPKALS